MIRMSPAIIPALALLFLSIFARFQSGSWLFPGAFFSLVWSGAVFIPLVLAPDFTVLAMGVTWIFASCFAVYVGCILGTGGLSRKKLFNKKVPTEVLSLPYINEIIIICILLGFCSNYLIISSKGYSLIDLFSLNSLVNMGHEFSVARYFEDYRPPFFAQICLIFVYAAPLFGGFSFSFNPRGLRRFLAYFALVPALLIAIIQTTRAVFLFAGILWIGSYFSGCIFRYGGRIKLFTAKRLVIFFIIVLFIIILFVVLQMSRGAVISLNLIPEIVFKLRAWFFGHLGAFSIWFQQNFYRSEKPTFGVYTFGGLYDLFGLHNRVPGLYVEQVEVAPGLETNIFTIYRGLIQDFTPPGALFILFVAGLLSGISYVKTIHHRIVFLPLLIAFYSMTMWFVTSIFNYNSIIGSFIIFTFYLVVYVVRCKKLID